MLPCLLALSLAPTADAEVVDLVATHGGTCALREDGRVACWGEHPAFPAILGIDERERPRNRRLPAPTLVPKLPRLTAIALAVQGWGVTESGGLVTWGAGRGTGDAQLGPVTDVVAADWVTCVRGRDGAVKCSDAGADEPGFWELRTREDGPLPAGDLRPGTERDTFEIHGDDAAFRVRLGEVDASRVGRRAEIEPIRRDVPTWAEAYAARRLGRRLPGAVVRGDCMLAEQRVWCWQSGREIDWTPHVVGNADLAGAGEDWLCLARGKVVECHRRGGGIRSFDLGAQVTMVVVDDRSGVFGAQGGRVLVVRLDRRAEDGGTPSVRSELRVRGTPVMAFEDADRVCVFVREGTRQCVGEDEGTTSFEGVPIGVERHAGLVRTPDGAIAEVDPGGATKLLRPKSDAAFPTGNRRTIVFDGDEVLEHLGRGSLEPWLVPADLATRQLARDRPSLASSDLQTCIIERSGAVHCTSPFADAARSHRLPIRTGPWTTKVELGGPALALFATELAVCARLGGGEVKCWGGRYGGPQGLSPDGEITDAIARAR